MLQKLKEIFVDNPSTAAITLAATGYFINLFKIIPLRIMNMIIDKVTRTIYVNDRTRILFSEVERALYDTYPELFSRHRMGSRNLFWDSSEEDRLTYAITPKHYIKMDWKNLTIVSIVKGIDIQVTDTLYTISIAMIGIGPGFKRLFHKFSDLIEKHERGSLYDDSLFLRVLDVNNDYLTPIRREDWIFDSVAKTRINNHLHVFLESKELFNRSGEIWKTGFLMHGRPGTGKSMFANYIAKKLGFSLVVVNSISNLNNFPIEMYSNKVILLEELDLLLKSDGEAINKSSSTEICSLDVQDAPDNKVASTYARNVATLLKFMDGIASPRNSIFFATTNRIEEIPEPFKRPGRFELVLELNGITKEDAINMCNAYGVDYRDVIDKTIDGDLYNPARLSSEIRKKLFIE